MMRIETLTSDAEITAAASSRLYRLLADGFLYPDRALFAAITAGRYRDEVADVLQTRRACAGLRWELSGPVDGLVASSRYIDFQAEYLRLFEVGMGMPPCPLYSGLYRGGRKAVMEELTRFYNFFGLSVEQGKGELPDHISTELEFMHFLTFKELAALHGDGEAAPYRRAQKDFLERQLVCWLTALETRLERLEPPAFYLALARLTSAFAAAELARLHLAQEPAAAGAEV